MALSYISDDGNIITAMYIYTVGCQRVVL